MYSRILIMHGDRFRSAISRLYATQQPTTAERRLNKPKLLVY